MDDAVRIRLAVGIGSVHVHRTLNCMKRLAGRAWVIILTKDKLGFVARMYIKWLRI